MVSELIALSVLILRYYDFTKLLIIIIIHAVEDLRLSIESADYMVKENNGSFVAAVVVSRAADFNYTITVETSDGTAVGKHKTLVLVHIPI